MKTTPQTEVPSGTQFWIVCDRRITKNRIYKDLVEGVIHSIYFNVDAAKSASYAIEKVWRIEINAIAESK